MENLLYILAFVVFVFVMVILHWVQKRYSLGSWIDMPRNLDVAREVAPSIFDEEEGQESSDQAEDSE